MLYLLHGDPFLVRRALDAIRDRLRTPDGLLEQNTVVLDGEKLTPLEFVQHATTPPFLAPARLVVVDGLVRHLSGVKASRGKKKDADDPLAQWRAAVGQLAEPGALPDTNTIILLEPGLDGKPAAFSIFAELAQVNHYPPVKDKELAAWVRDEAAGRGLKLAPGGVRTLVEAVGPDLWALHNELNKLETLAPDAQISEDLVRDSVAQARDAKVWDLTDAVVVGDERKAMRALAGLLHEGEPATKLAAILAGKYRELAVAKELGATRTPEDEIARAAGIRQTWKVKDILALASRYSWAALRRAYALLVDADLSVKRGLQDDESSLQLLVHELCGLAPRAATAARR